MLAGAGLQITKVVRGTVYIPGTYVAQNACTRLSSLGSTTSLTATRETWVVVRWSLGGGVASTRSEGDREQRTALFRTAQATPSNREKRHPQTAPWAGRKRQLNRATPLGAVGVERRTIASKTILVVGGGRSPKGLDKKPIWLELKMGLSGR